MGLAWLDDNCEKWGPIIVVQTPTWRTGRRSATEIESGTSAASERFVERDGPCSRSGNVKFVTLTLWLSAYVHSLADQVPQAASWGGWPGATALEQCLFSHKPIIHPQRLIIRCVLPDSHLIRRILPPLKSGATPDPEPRTLNPSAAAGGRAAPPWLFPPLPRPLRGLGGPNPPFQPLRAVSACPWLVRACPGVVPAYP